MTIIHKYVVQTSKLLLIFDEVYSFLLMFQAVTKAKLGYDPLEVNPEDMVRFAKEKPQVEMS